VTPPRSRNQGTASSVTGRDVERLNIRGGEPVDPNDHPVWLEKRRGIVLELAELAGGDAVKLHDAASGLTVSPLARDVLLDAAQEASTGDSPVGF
jgi:hypothetical protein